MFLSVSGAVLLGVIMILYFRKDGLKLSHAVVCGLFGFWLSGTSLAPGIEAGGAGLARLLGGMAL